MPTLFYNSGKATLWQGEALAHLAEMPDDAVDAVITDPPFSSGGLYRGDRTQLTKVKYLGNGRPIPLPDFEGDNRDQRSYGFWCALWLAQALRVTKTGGVLTMSTDWRQLPTVTDAVQAGGWIWRGVLPWIKPDARPQLGRYRQAAEFIVWATNGPKPLTGECLPGWWLAATPRDRHHQTEKPVQILRDLVRITPPGGTVLDPFTGCGTTGVAALSEGRHFIGVELSPEYCAVAAERLAQTSTDTVRANEPSLFDIDQLPAKPGKPLT